ncbi:MAG: DUF2442 domain-containing protein [Mucilaginibacter sp.]|uniref:DUF2442 domain-containing protein n=1 Tax=Mucilaginibacter sp. TaxID=1882438 RepID=UPI0034E4C760
MNKIIEINLISDFLLLLKFNNGESKLINFEPLIGKGISAQLLDKDYFSKVSIDNGGGLEWPNGMDFCPNFLKDYVSNNEAKIES